MCFADAPSPPPTPEPPAPPAPPPDPAKLELKTKAKRRSEEMAGRAVGTRRYRNDSPSAVMGNSLSGLNIPK